MVSWNTCACSRAGAAGVPGGELGAAAAAAMRTPILGRCLVLPGQALPGGRTLAPGLCLMCSCLIRRLGTLQLV